jgi:hypothetical protein
MSLELSKNTLLYKIEQVMTNDFMQLYQQNTTIQNKGNIDRQKSYYTNQKLRYIQNTYLFLLTIYIGIFIASTVTLYYNENVSLIRKMIILFSLFVLPIFSVKILIFLLFIIRDIYMKLPSNIYLLP